MGINIWEDAAVPFYTEHAGSRFVQNIGHHLLHCRQSYSRYEEVD